MLLDRVAQCIFEYLLDMRQAAWVDTLLLLDSLGLRKEEIVCCYIRICDSRWADCVELEDCSER